MCRYCFVIYQHADFGGLWAGWRLRGRDLISPTGERVNPQRLAGLLWCDHLRKQKSVRQDGTQVIRWQDRGAIAGDAPSRGGERRSP